MPKPLPAYRQLLETASFASRAHAGQLRKDGETPYASHPFRVCLIVRDLFGFDDARILMTALLHDTIEDTTTDFDELAERFGPEVARWAAFLSKDKRLPEKEREGAYLAALRGAPWQVKVCKLGDMLDNLWNSGKLSADSRSRQLRRSQLYFQGLSQDAPPELQGPLAIVAQVLGEMGAPTTAK